jgi:hypothetical protein
MMNMKMKVKKIRKLSLCKEKNRNRLNLWL